MRLFAFTLASALALAALACSAPVDRFFYGSLGLGEPRLAIATQNAGALTVLLYDLNGKLVKVLADFTATGDVPKGLTPFDSLSVAVLLDGADRIARLSLTGESLPALVANSNLNGTLWQMAHDSGRSRLFAIEANTIEAFVHAGERIGNPYIAATVGSCVLNTPRGLAFAEPARLIAVGTGNDDLNVYDVSGQSPTCLSANTAFGNVDPVAVLAHSNGLLYVATQGDDRIYSFNGDGSGAPTQVWAANLAQISNPTALLEMPDGSILVASDLTNSVVQIGTDGTYITTLIRDAFSGAITQMVYIDGI